jgi:predicted glycosyltransferase involved in capsule biosynthesis
MKIFVVIPWRLHPTRVRAFDAVVNFYRTNFKEFEIITSDSLDQDFNLAQARNLGAKKAIKQGADLVIFNDADFFTSPDAIQRAIDFAIKNNEIVAPYTVYHQHNDEKETSVFLRRMNYNLNLGKKFTPPTLSYNDSLPRRLWPCSGCIVVPPEIFNTLGGFEEKIKGWGPEDTMLHRAYFEKYGKLFAYVPGIAHSTFNDPTYRGDRPENQYYKDLVDFKDKRPQPLD